MMMGTEAGPITLHDPKLTQYAQQTKQLTAIACV
jgi:hypothetical protein